ncbi:terpene synthase family protein [Pantoea sp. B65]|uniref:terpene synthase family protein n=1 Tax=Pantoea sp. B65 TaxID=2813359 RepID=UPI0039B43823
MHTVDVAEFYIPFTARRNPHQQIATRHALAWLRFTALVDAANETEQLQQFITFGDLAARTYPDVGAAELEQIINWINWLFILDDQLDEPCDPSGADNALAMLTHLRQVIKSDGGATACRPLETAWQMLWQKLSAGMGQHAQQRFLLTIEQYLISLQQEITITAEGYIPDLLTFAEIRRNSGAAKTTLSINEYAYHRELPPAFCDSELYQIMTDATCDVIGMTNDIWSYAKEIAHPANNSYVVIFAHQTGCDITAAMILVNHLITSRVKCFLRARTKLPAFLHQLKLSAADRKFIQRYIAGMEHWMRGNLEWSAATPRYHH